MCLLTRFTINTGSSKLISYCHTALAALQNILVFNMLKHWHNGDFLILSCILQISYLLRDTALLLKCHMIHVKIIFEKLQMHISSDLAWCASLATVSFQVCSEDGQFYMYLLLKENNMTDQPFTTCHMNLRSKKNTTSICTFS